MDTQAKDIGRHEADLVTIKANLLEMRSDVTAIKDYITEKKAQRKLGFAILTAVASVGAYVGQYIPSFLDLFKAKGLN